MFDIYTSKEYDFNYLKQNVVWIFFVNIYFYCYPGVWRGCKGGIKTWTSEETSEEVFNYVNKNNSMTNSTIKHAGNARRQ